MTNPTTARLCGSTRTRIPRSSSTTVAAGTGWPKIAVKVSVSASYFESDSDALRSAFSSA